MSKIKQIMNGVEPMRSSSKPRSGPRALGLVFILAGACAWTTLAVQAAKTGSQFLLGPDLAGIERWEEKSFEGNTRYQKVSLGDKTALQATSEDSASGMFRKQRIDLNAFPTLTWQWRLEKGLSDLNEESKAGDDFAARVYVVVSDGWFFWQTRTLNYVWSSRVPDKQSWPNPYAPDNAVMLPLRTRRDAKGVWYSEVRNVQQDLKRYLGKHYDEIEAVAIMTDTDDSGGSATAYYGDIYFTQENVSP